ncbi:MAG: DUF2304 domain-containing protein [Acidobacteriota bacterium]
MDQQIQVISIIGSVGVMLFVTQLIRRRKLREEYALLWFAASLGLILISVWRGLLDRAAKLLGVAYPPSLLLLAGIAMGFILSIHFSLSLTRLSEQNKRLAQELALLANRIERGEGRPAPS